LSPFLFFEAVINERNLKVSAQTISTDVRWLIGEGYLIDRGQRKKKTVTSTGRLWYNIQEPEEEDWD